MNKILVIEDDINLRRNICELLENEGYQYEFAENGRDGIEKAKSSRPDLIISDIMMPGIDGFDVLEELMKNPDTGSIPFIFLTAKTNSEDHRMGMKLGADDYLFKPFQIEELLTAISIRLKKREMSNKKIDGIQEQISLKIPHELRNPLVPILGYADLIENENDIGQIKEMTRSIKKCGKTLHNRIEKLLIYKDLIIREKRDGKQMLAQNRTKINHGVVNSHLRMLSSELNPRERVIINVMSGTLPVNEFFLGIIIKELVENGLKYSAAEKSVVIKGYTDSGYYHIVVADTGQGINEGDIKAVTAFNKFGEESLAEPGLGLGLAIVKKITELHGGTISIKSEVGRYTICKIKFPLS